MKSFLEPGFTGSSVNSISVIPREELEIRKFPIGDSQMVWYSFIV
jgi:hypothetical protein